MPITADYATTLVRDFFVPVYANEHPLTRSVIASIPADKAGYSPDAVARPAIDLAWHIVSAEIRFIKAVASGAFDYGNSTRPDAVSSPMDVVNWYSGAFESALDRLKLTAGDQLMKAIDFRGIFSLPAYAYLQSGISHTIHHRGQLTTYLRPMGARVPSIYGESYDSRQARESGQKR
jgi:uncharacterized damage-inducible protein DinB